MKTKFILAFALFLFVTVNCKAQTNANVELRKLYYKAAVEEKVNDVFVTKLEELDKGTNALIKGYHGMGWMLKAKYAWNPYNKVAHFKKGKKLLEQAISNDQSNPELRFLRFCVQSNAPIFLGYSGELNDDKTLLITTYPNIKDEDLKQRIRDFMKDCSKLTAEEKKKFV